MSSYVRLILENNLSTAFKDCRTRIPSGNTDKVRKGSLVGHFADWSTAEFTKREHTKCFISNILLIIQGNLIAYCTNLKQLSCTSDREGKKHSCAKMDEGSTKGTEERWRKFTSNLTLALDRPLKGEKVRRRLGMRIEAAFVSEHSFFIEAFISNALS